MCRCCKIRLNGNSYYNVHDKFGKGMPPAYLELIKQWLEVDIGYHDKLPQRVCAFCCNKLKFIVEFIANIQSANEKQKQPMESPDVNKLCRCCLSTNATDYHDIHKPYHKLGPTYAGIINDLSQLEIKAEDGLTQKICNNCLSTVENIFDFGLNIRYVNKEFRKPWRPILENECRCCRDVNADEYKDIFQTMGNGPTYAGYIRQITYSNVIIRPDDGFSKKICNSCSSELSYMFDFGARVKKNVENLDESERYGSNQCRCCTATADDLFYGNIEDVIKPGLSYGGFIELIGFCDMFEDDLTTDICSSCMRRVRDMFIFTKKTIVLTDERLRNKKPWKLSNQSDTDKSDMEKRHSDESNSDDDSDSDF